MSKLKWPGQQEPIIGFNDDDLPDGQLNTGCLIGSADFPAYTVPSETIYFSGVQAVAAAALIAAGFNISAKFRERN